MEALVKPRLRGVFHEIAFFAAVALAAPLTLTAEPGRARLSAIVFSACLAGCFGMSALYHRPTWRPAIRSRLARLDHAGVYLLIAGTYTPFTLIGLRGEVGRTLFIAIWSLAAAGIAFKLFFTGRFKLLSTLVYVAMGWLVLLAIKPVWQALDAWTLGWLLAGGVAYTLGTVFYHRPSMRYSHAVWHLFVIAGSTCHYIAVLAQVHATA